MDSRDGVEMLRTPTGVLPNWIAGRLLLVLRFRLQYAHGRGSGFVGITLHAAWGGQLHRAVDTGYWEGGVSVHTGK